MEGDIYKGTTVSDVFVRRRTVLERDKFITYHDYERDKDNKKTWYLDRKCELSNVSEKPTDARVRPRGTWTLAAAVVGVGQSVTLYTFTLSWPTSWAAKGYTAFVFGFEMMEEASKWRGLLREGIEHVRLRSQLRKHTRSGSNAQTLESSLPSAVSQAPDMSPTAVSRVPTNRLSPDASMEMVGSSRRPDDTMSLADDPGKFAEQSMGGDMAALGPDTDSESEEDPEARMRIAAEKRAARNAFSGRWVPYKQINGLAIYYHDSGEEEECRGLGGEYMVSAVVRGPPAEVLDVLMNGSTNTTILGPATRVEVLKRVTAENEEKEIQRLVLDAPGWAGYMCAPREMVVERLLKKDEGELYVVLLKSLPDKQEGCHYAPVLPEDSERVKVQEAHKRASGRRWFNKPVLGRVRGAYTISPLEDRSLTTSPESLITCIVKVDLGGALGGRSWAKPLCDTMGWTDAFLDRILMTVILVRDEVEHSRFLMNPLGMLAPAAAQSEEERASEAKERSAADAGSVLSPKPQMSASTTSFREPVSPALLMGPAATSSVVMPGAVPPPTMVQQGPSMSRMFSMISRDRHSLGPMAAPLKSVASALPPVPLDLDTIKRLCTLETKYWEEIHQPNKDAPFVLRGPTYLKDKKKIAAGQCTFTFAAMDVVELPEPVQHVARFLPSIRDSSIPWGIIINLIIPGTPLLGIVATFITDTHPDQALKNPPKHPMEEDHDWQPFDFVLHKFIKGDTATRNMMLKLIPHIADGSWAIRHSVGTTPVILGKALKTTYHETPQYIEIDIDISANSTASYVTGLVRGATKSLVIDMGFVLEGTAPWELPEALLGALRLNRLDIKTAKKIDITRELPLRPALVVGSASGRSAAPATGTVPEQEGEEGLEDAEEGAE